MSKDVREPSIADCVWILCDPFDIAIEKRSPEYRVPFSVLKHFPQLLNRE